MKVAPALLGAFALAAAGAGAGQEKKEERPAASPPRLNLKLDNPAQYTRETPREGAARAETLPALGANARPLPKEAPAATRGSPYPSEPSANP